MNRQTIFQLTVVLSVLFCFYNSAFGQARPDPREYVDLPVQSPDEVKRKGIFYPPGPTKRQTGWIIDYKDGRHLQQSLREDGTLQTEFESYMPGGAKGMSRARRNYDLDGKTIISEEKLGIDGKKTYTLERLIDGVFEIQYFSQGKLVNKISLAYQGINKIVIVYDDKNNELYRQIWTSGIAGYVLDEVKEMLPGKAWRVISVDSKKVLKVKYFRADGTLEKEEMPDNLSIPVDAVQLDEIK
jgi:hypothetical protein